MMSVGSGRSTLLSTSLEYCYIVLPVSSGRGGVAMADPPKTGSIVHAEYHVKEPKKVEKFYATGFAWKFQAVPGSDYALFEAPSGPGAGVAGLQLSNRQPGDMHYQSVPTV